MMPSSVAGNDSARDCNVRQASRTWVSDFRPRASSPAAAQPGPVVSYALRQGVPVAAALWGLLAWREFAGVTIRVKMLMTSMLILYAAGVTVLSLAPLYSK